MGLAEPSLTRGLVSAAVGLTLVLASVPSAPTAGGSHGAAWVSTQPLLADCDGPDRWIGFQGEYGFLDYRFCVYVEAWLPDAGGVLDRVQFPPDVQRHDCPGEFEGYVLDYQGTRAGLCVQLAHTIPRSPWINVAVDLSQCDVPDRDEGGEDPAVYVMDGGVAVCLFPVVEPGDLPNLEVSPEPCQPQTVDPEVRAAGGGAQVCMDFEVLTVGSDEVNDVVQAANETVSEAYACVDEREPRNRSYVTEPANETKDCVRNETVVDDTEDWVRSSTP